ncbi:hypothetical protein GGE46_006097 [Rhizobium etli]|uniref:Uncharacterized protein n=1 Tax=Rhizobium etli TaxID=29449 RepID=A0A7W6VHT5_RHIET|nr:hypothetical protein [Rhizobium etli]MBB4539308.1 hypothetical protein [Rhizobium etli]
MGTTLVPVIVSDTAPAVSPVQPEPPTYTIFVGSVAM